MPPFFWKQIQKRKPLCATVMLVGLVFSFALVFLERCKTEIVNQIDRVYDELTVTCSVTNLTGTQADELELPEWVINLFFTGITVQGNPRPEQSFDTYFRDVRAKTTAQCTLDGSKMRLCGITAAEGAANLPDVTWRSGYNLSLLDSDGLYCLVPIGVQEDTVQIKMKTKEGEEFTKELQVAGTHTGDSACIYCPWAFGLAMVEQTRGYRKADSIGATFADNKQIEKFWDVWGSRYFVEPTREGIPVKWEASPVYVTYPYALTIYDDILRSTTGKLERNQQLFAAASWLLLLAAFGVGFVLNFQSLRHRKWELKLQHMQGVRPVGILLGALLEQGLLCFVGAAVTVVGFRALFHTPPDIGILVIFWCAELTGTILAYVLTMNKRFLETNMQGE